MHLFLRNRINLTMIVLLLLRSYRSNPEEFDTYCVCGWKRVFSPNLKKDTLPSCCAGLESEKAHVAHFEAEMDKLTLKQFSLSGPEPKTRARAHTPTRTHARTHKRAGTQSLCLATSIEQVSLVMHHRALGSRRLGTEGGGESGGKAKGQSEGKRQRRAICRARV